VDKSKVKCFKCHKYGHYKSECHANLNKNGGKEKSIFVEKEDETSLLMACHMNKKNHKGKFETKW